jgi:hypothetical protein
VVDATVSGIEAEGGGVSNAVNAVRSAVTCLNDGDIDAYLAHFAPSGGRWINGLGEPLALTLTDVGAGLHQLHAAFEGLRLDEDALFGDDRFACARWRMRGRHVNDYLGRSPTGRSIDVETCEVYEIGAERIVTSWVYGDVLGQLVRQIGAEVGGDP